MSKQLKGSLMVITAGIAWGISGVSGQYLMAHGVNVNLLTSLRLILAGTLLTASVFFRQRDKLVQAIKDKKTLVSIVLFALFGLVLNQYAYLSAIQYTNAGTATVLQYVTPVLILAFVCAKNRRFPTVSELVAIIMAIAGTFIIATHGQVTELAITPIGLFWGLFSAVTYALYILLPAKAIEKWGSLIVIGLGMLLGGLIFPIAIQAWKYELPLTGGNLLALFGLVFIGTVFAYTVFLKGTTMVGAVKGSLLA
ncbi:MAG: DMT family transporter, partial [Streptococcus salivarius]